MTVPSRRRTSPQPPFRLFRPAVKGNLGAAFVARPVPCGFDAVRLGQDGKLAGRRESAGLFAHGDGRGAILADLPEIAEVLGREGIFDEEQLELFGVLAELHGLVGRDALMHVVKQLDLFGQLASPFVFTLFPGIALASPVG